MLADLTQTFHRPGDPTPLSPQSIGSLAIRRSLRAFFGFAILAVLISAYVLASSQPAHEMLHIVLDVVNTGTAALLALFLWRIIEFQEESQLRNTLAIIFAIAAASEGFHALMGLDWHTVLPFIAELKQQLRPVTWPPTVYFPPIAIGFAIWWHGQPRHHGSRTIGLFLIALYLLINCLCMLLPAYQDGWGGIHRPHQLPVPFAWMVISTLLWRRRAHDALYAVMALCGALYSMAALFMLFSTAPHDGFAMVAHFWKMAAYLLVLFNTFAIADLDLKGRLAAEQNLQDAHQFYYQIVASAQEGIIVTDIAGQILVWNPFMETLTGIPASQCLGKIPLEIFPFLQQTPIPDGLRRARIGELVRNPPYRYTLPDSNRCGWISSLQAPLRREDGRIIGVIETITDITDRKLMEDELRTKQERLTLALESAGDGDWDWDLQHNTFYCSPQWKVQLGYGADEIGESNTEWEQRIHPDDRDACFAAFAQHLRGETPCYHNEHRMRCKEGGYRWILDRGRVIARSPNGKALRIVGTFSDITERKEIEATLAMRELFLRTIVDTVVEGIIVIDQDGVMQSVNPAAEQIFGFSAADLVGKNVTVLMPDPYKSAHDGYLRHYLQTNEKKIIGIGREVLGLRRNGSTFPMDLAVNEMEVQGKRMFTGILRDITERKKIERMKSEFVSTVSHELRTPLTSIRGALSLVLGKASAGMSDKARQLLETANRNSERLTLLINDILDLEKIESGRLDFDFKPLDLIAITQQALVANECYAQQHNVRLQLVEAPPQAKVWADEHRLLQIFANLLSNACKYSPPEATVEVSIRTENGRLRIGVRDQGRGIPLDFRPQIFQRFAQADSSDTRQKGGTGLGLSISKAIVERHGGLIAYQSDEGIGTEFYFTLPEYRTTLEPPPSNAAQPLMLICEDNADVAMVLSHLLEHEGIASDRATTAAQALEFLQSKTYRGLLLDLGLPDMDGLTLIRQLRDSDNTRDLPIIVISGRIRDLGGDAWCGDTLTVMDWLQKPVDRDRLRTALAQALHWGVRPRILHVEDDADFIQITQALVEDTADYTYATSLAEARQKLSEGSYDLLLLDLSLPDGAGVELLAALPPETQVVVLSGQETGSTLSEQVAAALTHHPILGKDNHIDNSNAQASPREEGTALPASNADTATADLAAWITKGRIDSDRFLFTIKQILERNEPKQ